MPGVYVDDIVRGIVATLDRPATSDPDWDSANPSPHSSVAPWHIHNIGNVRPVTLMHYIEVLEDCLGKKAIKNYLPLQPRGVPDTSASVETLWEATGYKPDTTVEVGIQNFVEWYQAYYH